VRFLFDGQQVEQLNQFRYLGSLISENGYCTKEIKSRIEMAKKVFTVYGGKEIVQRKLVWN